MYSSPKLHAYTKTRFKCMHSNVCHLIEDTHATYRDNTQKEALPLLSMTLSLPATNVACP